MTVVSEIPARYPFTAVVGQDRLKLALILSAISPGIFLYKNGRVTALPLRISQPALLKPAVWQKVRVERNIVTRLMRVYVGNLSAPVMETKDYELIMGYIGFGAAEGAVRVDNVRVWAPTMLDDSDK